MDDKPRHDYDPRQEQQKKGREEMEKIKWKKKGQAQVTLNWKWDT